MTETGWGAGVNIEDEHSTREIERLPLHDDSETDDSDDNYGDADCTEEDDAIQEETEYGIQ